MGRAVSSSRRSKAATTACLMFGCLLFGTAVGENTSRVAGFRRALLGRFASFGNRPSDNAADRTRRGSIRKLQDETPSPVEGSPAPFAEGSPAPVDDGTPAPEGGGGDGDDEYSGTDENYDDGGYSEEVDPTPAPDGEEVSSPTPSPAERAQPTPFPVEGAQQTPAPAERAQPTPFPAEGAQPTPFPAEGAQPTPFPAEGAQPTPFPAEGAQPTPFPAEGAQPTPFPAEGGQDFESTSEGVPTPSPGSTTPTPFADRGITTTSPQTGSVAPVTPAPQNDGSEGTTPVPAEAGEGEGEVTPTVTPSASVAEPTMAEVPSTDAPETAPPFAPSTCSNGIAGVQNGAACCKEECGQCGGEGCGAVPGTNGASDCCSSTILEEQDGTFCGDAPCIIEGITPAPTEAAGTPAPYNADSTCSNGIQGVDNGSGVCCRVNCGFCGGQGCGAVSGTNGASDCCPDTIIEESGGAFCGEAPCVMEGFTPAPANPAFDGTAAPVDPSTCSNGLSGYQDGDVCCVEACGQCGGAGCGTIPGTGGSANCCSSTIRVSGVVCGEPPCIIEGYTPAPAVVGGGTAAPISDDAMCSNGMAGFQDGAVCCAANCGQCGGEGCGSVPGTAGSSACCSSIIEVEGEFCGVAGAAPCIIEGYTPAPVVPDFGSAAPVFPEFCSNGLPGYQDLDVCCLQACGQCGGAGCGTIPGTGGNEFCCSSTIRENGQVCGDGVEAPCIIGDYTPSPVNPAFGGSLAPFEPSMCSNGIAGVQNGAACCSEECGQCGGAGCGTISGTGGSGNCCASAVLQANQICGLNGQVAPCVIENYTPAPQGIPGTAAPFVASTCSNGFAGVQDAAACCDERCGQCGGVGCGTLPGTGGSEYCCSSTIIANGTSCAETGEAPCFIDGWAPTPAPVVPETVPPFLPSVCSNGLAGYQDGSVCCLESCGMCGGVGCGNVSGTNGASDCCPSSILQSNQICGGSIVAPCVIPSTPAPTMSPAITPVPTPVPFISGNARDFANETSAAWSRPTTAGHGLLIPVLTAAVVAVVGAFAFEVRQPRS